MTSVVLLLAVALQRADEQKLPDIWDRVVAKKVTEVELLPSVLGDGWKRDAGIRIDDLEDISALPEPERRVAQQLREQFAPLGIRSVADYTLVKSGFPLNTVTVRVFLFRNPDQCREWWEKKYRYAGWEKHYKPVASDEFVAVDSLQENKRAIAFGNAWITAHQLQKGDEHLTCLRDLIVRLSEK